MGKIVRYEKRHEAALLALLEAESDWSLFVNEGAIDRFRNALQDSETYVCEYQGSVIGYLRALVDAFGIYVSELYVAPDSRNNGFGRRLLMEIKNNHPDQEVYVLSDEDRYYEKLGFKRVGSVFHL